MLEGNFGGLLLCVACLSLGVLLALGNGIRIVPEHRRLVVFRLGRLGGVRGPGLAFVVPLLDRSVTVDLNDQKLEIKQVQADTWDKLPVIFDLGVQFRVTDPAAALVQVADYREGLRSAATVAARDSVAQLGWADLAARHSNIERDVQDRLAGAAAPWGITVGRVEIRNIARR